MRRWHIGGFTLQCLAYGANDGQKMLAVMAVAAGAVGRDGLELSPWQVAVIGAAFLVGAAFGLPRVARSLGGGVVPVRPLDVATTEIAAASVVLATAAVGAPVSMTQAIAGAQVGSGVTRGRGRIRWGAAARIAGAWVITLPTAFLAAMLVGMLVVPSQG